MNKLWSIIETSFDPTRLNHSETVFTQGNGYLGTRGVFEERYPGEQRTTFVNGVFDDVPVVFTELVNFPDWLDLEIILNGERFNLTEGNLISFERCLDLRNGLLLRRIRWTSPQGLTTELKFKRFISFADVHFACLQVEITAEDYSGSIEIRSGLDACTDNLNFKHWKLLEQGFNDHMYWLHLKTQKTGIEAGISQRLQITAAAPLQETFWDTYGRPTLATETLITIGQPIQIEKVVAIVTSREEVDPLEFSKTKLSAVPKFGWKYLWNPHELHWQENWRRSDIIIEGDEEAQLAIRFNIYNLLIAAPCNDEYVNIGAKTLSGFGYRGHSFWDTEIFMLPFFTFTQPEIAHNLLSYRFHNLKGAREKANLNGFEGAQFPWESAGDGYEVTPTWVPDPKDRTNLIRIWTGDIQIHISADIAFAIWQYWCVTQDDDFLADRGAEIILETAKFWASRAEWNADQNRFEFTNVIGPDENHDHINNNAYTNYLVQWHLRLAFWLTGWLNNRSSTRAQRLFDLLALSADDINHFKYVAERIFCPLDLSSGLVEQFEGYFSREYIDLKALEGRTESIQGMLGIEKTNQSQILKQPDVVMLMYLLPELFKIDTIEKNYRFYSERTDFSFGSSLGFTIQSIMASRLGLKDEAYHYFTQAAFTDIDNLRGNSGDGIHAASAGGLWQTIVFGFAGLQFDQNAWTVSPRLPAQWKRLSFKFFWRGEEVNIDVKAQGESGN